MALALLGSPIFVIIAAFALIAFYSIGVDSSVIIIEMSRLADTPLLLSLPLFIFAGTMLSESKAPRRMLNLSQVLLGWLPGGLAVISLLICALFTAFTGASGVTIFALGGLLFPALIKDNYSEKFSLGLLTTTGSLGLLFPPECAACDDVSGSAVSAAAVCYCGVCAAFLLADLLNYHHDVTPQL